jgi:hypothetical protein
VAPLSEDPLDANDLDSAALAAEEEADAAFLLTKGDTEDMPSYQPQWAHAPHWPVVSCSPISIS